jgi:dienelactone hydrolase
MRTEKIDYSDGEIALEGHLALPAYDTANKPVVLVAHTVRGQTDFERDKAEALADLGWAGFALDVYGKGFVAKGREDAMGRMRPLLDDRALLERRLLAGLDAVRGHPRIDASRVAAIGFCFGGLCALDLARSGADLRAVVAFHGLFTPRELPTPAIRARVLALHGYDDPMAKPEQMLAFATEMTDAGADWQIHAHGGTMHAFTNPDANDPERGTVYNARTDRRAWRSMRDFLEEALA